MSNLCVFFFFRKNHSICGKCFVNSGHSDGCKLEHQNMADMNLLMYFDIKSVDIFGYWYHLTVIHISWQNFFQFCGDLFCSFPIVLLMFSCHFLFLSLFYLNQEILSPFSAGSACVFEIIHLASCAQQEWQYRHVFPVPVWQSMMSN